MPTGGDEDGCTVPREPWLRLFLRFLRFGGLAWGGPVAQIAMIRQELVDEERWISSAQFNRVLAVYQVLPGPEAHELCVYFGMRARGRWGGVLAGLGFMLPGFVLMFALSWAYVRYGMQAAQGVAAVFAAVQVAVAALVVRAVVRIGEHVVTDRWLWAIAIGATVAQLAGVHFGLILMVSGGIYLLAQRQHRPWAWALAALAVAGMIGYAVAMGGLAGFAVLSGSVADAGTVRAGMPLAALFWSGLKAGLLTFGGAYTAIPLLQRDAVTQGAWMSNTQFLDGLALSGLLPAPLIIFSTFVGYLGGGPWGALAMTLGVFLPAFAFTLVAHDALERLVRQTRIRLFLEGLTAGVVGLIAGTTVALLKVSLTGVEAVALFALALAVLFASKAKLAIPAVIAAAALWGWLSSVT